MYGVLYAISPELFPAKDRGTGNGLTATATRVFGIIVSPERPHAYFARGMRNSPVPVLPLLLSQAPVIALYANLETAVPVYVSGGLIIGSGAIALLLPYEPRGKASI